MNLIISKNQFNSIKQYIEENDIQLLISDFNGVLDDYYAVKHEFLRLFLNTVDDGEHHFVRLTTATDIAYSHNKKATLQDTIRSYCTTHNIMITRKGKIILERGPKLSKMTPEAYSFLDSVGIPVLIYSAQPESGLCKSLRASEKSRLTIRAISGVQKPDPKGLKKLIEDENIALEKVCVLGDSLIDDLLPAKLLGAHTILVSPFANKLI